MDSKTHPASTANSKGENVPEMESLISRVNDLQRSLDFWSTGNVWFVAATVMVAAALFFTQFMSVRRAKDLSRAQSELSEAKERQLVVDLKEKDERISEAGEKASAADQRAAEANERAAQLEMKAEKLHKENIDLEASLSPRIFKDQGGAARNLAVFTPVNAVIEYFPDFECRRTAGQIAGTLAMARWRFKLPIENPDEAFFSEGVTVGINAAGSEAMAPDIRRAAAAVDVLIVELNKTGIKAGSMPFVVELPKRTPA